MTPPPPPVGAGPLVPANVPADVAAVISALGLAPHPCEGGWFVETWRSDETLSADAARRSGPRSVGTAIYYLLTPGTFSEMHRLAGDEVFHHYLGDAVEMLQLPPGGPARHIRIGRDLAAGERPQVLAPRGVWQGTRLLPGGRFALLGCTVAPGFDYADYEAGRRADLVRAWPAEAELITLLTRG